MATMQDLIEQWKKEAAQSQTVTGPEIPNIAMYQAQNDVHRDYGAANSALAREVANQQMLSQPVIQMAPTGLDVTMQEKQDLVNARREAEALQAAQSIPSGTGIGSSLQMLPSMADYQSNAVSNRDGVLKYIADHPDEAEYVTRFLELNNGEMDGIKYKNYLKQQKDYELAQKWVDPNYKMTKEEEEYGEKLALDRYKVLSSKKNRTPEEDAELRTMDDLFMKTDEFSSFALNSADEAVKAVRGVKWLTDHGFMGPVQQLANKVTDPISNKLLGAYDEVDKTPIQNAQVQNPIASGAGRFATNAALYAATNPAFDAIAEASGLTGAGKFALNQAAQFGQDVALDTIPTYVDMTKDGSLSDEEKKELAKGALLNAGGNLVLGGLGEAFKGANRADIPEVDKVVKEATEQAENAQKRIQELARQNEEALPALGDMTKGAEDIPYTVTKAESELPKMETPKAETQKTATRAEIEELNNELSNMWGDNAAKETKSAAKTQRLDLPEEVTEKGASDFQEIYDSLESMRQVAEKSGNEKVVDKFNKLSKAVSDYENAFFKEESEETLTSAKKAADAARQSFIREVKKTNPNYTGELTGTKLGNAAYRRTSMKAAEEANQELADSITEADNMLNTNRWAKDAAPETQSPFKGVDQPKTRLKMDLMHQADENNVRHGTKTTEDLWDELKAGENAEAPKTAKAAKEAVEEVPEGKKLSRLHSTLQNTDKLTDAEKETFKNKNGFYYDPENQKKLDSKVRAEVDVDGAEDKIYERYMNKTTTEPYTGEDTHRIFQASAKYNALMQEALEEGHEGAAKLYAAKARNLMLEERYHATAGGQFNAAIGYYARTPQGYIDKANDILYKRLQKFTKANPKLSSDIDDMASAIATKLKNVDVDGIMAGSDEAAKQTLRNSVLDAMNEVVSKGNKQTKNIFKDLSAEELDEIINSKYQKDLARTLDMFAMGSYGVKPETVDKVLDIFADAEKYDISSKEYYKLERKAFDLIMNDLNAGKGKTWGEKIDTWRYFAMLSNPLTHVKNTAGNLNQGILDGVRNNLAAGIEAAADRVAKAKGAEGISGGRTKSFLNLLNRKDKQLIELSGKDFDEKSFRTFKNGGNRWVNLSNELASAGDVYNGKNIVGKAVNKLAGANDAVLSAEDTFFGKQKYQTAMAGFLKANGADASIFKETDDKSLELLEQARNYAMNQANASTFHTQRELSKNISNWIQNGKTSDDPAYKALARTVDFMFPFVKTPGNILRTSLAYSPAEFAKVAADFKGWRSGAIPTSKYIEEIATGLTGTGLMIAGAALREAGLINVSSNDADLTSYNKKRGLLNNSVEIAGRTYSLSELIPSAFPILNGAMVWDTIKAVKKGNTEQAADVLINGLSGLGENLTDMTMLSGFSSALEAVRYADSSSEIWKKLGTEIGKNAAGQFLPTIGRKIEQTIDPTQRSTYSGSKSDTIRSLESTGKYFNTKLPGLQQLGEKMETSNNKTIASIGDKLTNEPQINGWGEEVKNEDYGIGLPGRAIHNTVDVFNSQTIKMNDNDKFLSELYKESEKDPKVLQYGNAPTSDANVKDYRMTEKEWTEYQKKDGKMREELLNAFRKDSNFEDIPAADKVDILDKLKDFAKQYNQNEICGEKAGLELKSTNQKLSDIYSEEGAKGVIDKLVDESYYSAAVDDAGIEKSSGARKAYDEGGAEAVKEYASKREILDKYDLETNSNAGKEISKLVAEGKLDEADKIAEKEGKVKEILNKYDLNANTNAAEEVREAVEKGKLTEADKIASDAAKEIKAKAVPESKMEDYKAQLEKYELKDNDNTKHVYKAYGSAGVETYSKIGSEGISRYETAKASGSTIPSLKDYAKTYTEIDSYGEGDSKNNKKVDQKEFAAYAQAKGLSQDEAREQAKLYGDEWKYIPTLQSDGSYKFTDPNKQSSGGGRKSSGGQAAKIYASAQAEGNAPTQAEFNSTYKAIDSYGTSNGRVTQAELISYGIANGMNEAQIQALARTYGDWTKIPVLQPDGTYQWKKVR